MSVTWSATAEEAGVPSAETAVPSQPPQTAAAPAAAPAAEPDEDSATSILVDCGSILVHVICALVQGVIGLLPLMLMWSVLCTLAAVTFVPMDLVLASAHVIRQGRQQGYVPSTRPTAHMWRLCLQAYVDVYAVCVQVPEDVR